jgi:hypothetical protein
MGDLRYALRLLRSVHRFTFTVIITIALGIGASMAIFSVVNAILVRPLPFAGPQRLLQMAEKNDRAARGDSVWYLHTQRTRRSGNLHGQRDLDVPHAAARSQRDRRA